MKTNFLPSLYLLLLVTEIRNASDGLETFNDAKLRSDVPKEKNYLYTHNDALVRGQLPPFSSNGDSATLSSSPSKTLTTHTPHYHTTTADV